MNECMLWLSMGGYAQYIWSAYGLTCFVLFLHIIVVKRQKRRSLAILKRWFARS